MERRRFTLWFFVNSAVELGSGGLVESDSVFHAQDANGFEQPQRPKGVGIGGVFRRFKRNLHVALCSEVVDLRRLRFLDDANEICRIGHVAIVHQKRNFGS